MTIVLHHYPASLFSEKIRLLLGHYGLDWSSVVIPSIMPRPALMPLSGGYRKTPVLQIDANVYCDTKVIATALARHTGDRSLYAHGFPAVRVADWADAQLFQITVAMNFAPEAAAALLGQIPPEEAAAFQADRAKLAEGGNIVSISPGAAAAYLEEALVDLEARLAVLPNLFGDALSIADFSVYHCLWFLANNPVNAPLLERFPAVQAWRARMAGIGHGNPRPATGADALALARDCEPKLPMLDSRAGSGSPSVGSSVTVTPIDYGRVPVAGELAAVDAHEIVLMRHTEETGAVMTHFPRAGFEVDAAG